MKAVSRDSFALDRGHEAEGAAEILTIFWRLNAERQEQLVDYARRLSSAQWDEDLGDAAAD